MIRRDRIDVLGLSTYDSSEHRVQVVTHRSRGDIDGSFPTTNNEAAGVLFSSSGTASRRRRAVEDGAAAPTIQSPLFCLLPGEALVFQISEDEEAGDDEENATAFHYPVYVKDHLLNTNLEFDYGGFRQLASYLNSAVNVSTYAHVFSESGTYVFRDSIVETSQIIVTVVENGTSCDQNGNDFRVLPASTFYLNGFGIAKLPSVNQEPNFTAINVVLITTVVLVTLMVLAVFIWEPKAAGIELPNGLKPRYRQVDEPKVVYVGENPKDLDTLEKRGVAVGAPASESPARDRRALRLDDFNVRTLYDKLEDQTLYVSAQLAQQQANLQGFYNRISQQTEGLKSLVSETEILSAVDKNRQFQQQHGTRSTASTERGEPVGSETPVMGMGPVPAAFATSGHETELTSVLRDLLAKMEGSSGGLRRRTGKPKKGSPERTPGEHHLEFVRTFSD